MTVSSTDFNVSAHRQGWSPPTTSGIADIFSVLTGHAAASASSSSSTSASSAPATAPNAPAAPSLADQIQAFLLQQQSVSPSPTSGNTATPAAGASASLDGSVRQDGGVHGHHHRHLGGTGNMADPLMQDVASALQGGTSLSGSPGATSPASLASTIAQALQAYGSTAAPASPS